MLRSIWSTNNLAWIKLARRTLSTVVENVSKSDTTAKTTKSIVVEAKKTNLPQSPLKMKFLVSLIRGAWVPDALAQLKFSPKRRADDVAKILKRANSIAKIYHNAIPQELIVKEAIVTKGVMQKKLRIMGRGRTGIGRTIKSHVTIKVEKIDFAKMIEDAKTMNQKKVWAKRQKMVDNIKLAQIGGLETK